MKKYIFCIPSSTDFAVATAVLIYSIKKNLTLYEMEFVALHGDIFTEVLISVHTSGEVLIDRDSV